MTTEMRRYVNSERLYEQACRVLPGGVNSSLRNVVPHLVFTKTAGALLVDADGNEYIDYQAAFGPPLLGHNHPAVNRRVAEALALARRWAGPEDLVLVTGSLYLVGAMLALLSGAEPD